jgi:poly-gamma-glutamate synthesis protein (capsule biosynthesis protein)
VLKKNEIQVVGAGKNIAEANQHVVVEKNGIEIAFVNRGSLLRADGAATENRPGIAPLEIKTFYDPLENLHENPGSPARTITIPHHKQLSELRNEISKAKSKADVVVACFHWGVHGCHDIAMYQPEVAYEAIDCGADLVIGTHPHVLQAIDVYKGKPIFYSLGNFAFSPADVKPGRSAFAKYSMQDFPFDAHLLPSSVGPKRMEAAKQTILMECDIIESGIQKTSFRPVISTDEGIPTVLEDPNQEEYRKIVNLIVRLSRISGAQFCAEDGKLTVDVEETQEINVRELIKDRQQSYPSLCWIS